MRYGVSSVGVKQQKVICIGTRGLLQRTDDWAEKKGESLGMHDCLIHCIGTLWPICTFQMLKSLTFCTWKVKKSIKSYYSFPTFS